MIHLTDLQSDLPNVIKNISHEVAWSLGMPVKEEEIVSLLSAYLKEVL
jgi:hypothetical protein